MGDKPNTANQQQNKTLIRSKLDEQIRQADKIKQEVKEEEKSEIRPK